MLTITDLSHIYPNGVKAISNLNLTIPTGMFGLLGPNGAGKSTLMRSIATLQTPTQGAIQFGEIDVLKQPTRLRAQLGYLPQEFGVYPRVSALQLLDHFARLKGFSKTKERKEMIEGLLSQVNLWEARKKAVASFSGGMRQRFGIAQALIGDPKLLIVDEPTAGLDPEERARFLNLLASLSDEAVIILSTHIVEDVSDLCPSMAIMAGGRIVLEGKTSELIGRLDGIVWRKVVSRTEVAEHQSQYRVIATRLFAGETVLHVLSETDPANGFLPLQQGLEELYMATMQQDRAVDRRTP
ncbi:ABC transporter ATP-binding protein NatA [Candidatus Phycosocius bacilliformis]|uniref:ABC transporter ATP-binding protein NatA n=1 Tax=Candidatus Phycosocius bacilliformis TaxID=1445552 RepID=A0A2P2EA20_9PROT|nr:ABC transporter ATP-binding protein [Candidatus Phycosocius bacilliformis]GBF57908.1 ABC transporter ATP-binding protein NatA [Candidatus Phycosocius bacilliformis]